MSATMSRVRKLMAEAGEAGDMEQVVLCLVALGLDDGRFPEIARVTRREAQTECARVLREAEGARRLSDEHVGRIARMHYTADVGQLRSGERLDVEEPIGYLTGACDVVDDAREVGWDGGDLDERDAYARVRAAYRALREAEDQ